MLRTILSILWFSVFAFSMGEGLAQDQSRAWEQKQVESVKDELKLVSKSLKTDKIAIPDSVQLAIENFEGERKSVMENRFFCVPKPIREKLWESLKDAVTADQQSLLETHIQEAENFVDRSRRDAIKCMTVFLDNHLFLTSEQFEQIEQVISTTWSDEQNFAAYLFTFRSLRTEQLIDSFDQEAIQRILTVPQRELFAQIQTLATDPHPLFTESKSIENDEFVQARASVQLCIKSLTQELENYIELKEKQKSLIRVAGNGAAKSVFSKWSQPDIDGVESESYFTTPIIHQLMREAILEKTLRRLLGDRFEQYEQERIRRQEIRTRCLVNYLLFFYFNNSARLRVSQKARDAISDAICEKLNQLDYVDFQIVSRVLLSESKQIFEDNLEEEDWKVFKSRLQ